MPTHRGDAATPPVKAARRRSRPPPQQPDDLPVLRQRFPGYDIWRETRGEHTRYVARRRDPGLSPHTVVTADPDELCSALQQDGCRYGRPSARLW
jgi:hypothetical protein